MYYTLIWFSKQSIKWTYKRFQLFTGGESGYNNAVQSEIKDHNDLVYKARFISGQDENTCIADREYNAKEIAKAAMGDCK